MYDKIIHLFIQHPEHTHDAKVRGQYGILFAILSIILNTLMCAGKMIFGFLSHSQAMMTDGVNNLSDAASNIVVLFGFHMSVKHPDAHHPYGHGRYEYIAGVIVSITIISMGLMACRDGIMKIIHPEQVIFRLSSLVVLFMAIVFKALMYWFDMKTAQRIDSDAFTAAAKDSLNDILTTFSAILVLLFSFVSLPLDGIISVLVSLWIIKGGYQSLRTTLNPLLGARPDPELIKNIKTTILENDRILGLHDLMLHDYGVTRQYLSVHAEVDAKENLVAIHDVIDALERKLSALYHVDATIHIDPIDRDDPLTKDIYHQVKDMISQMNPRYSIHDLRIIKGHETIKVIFDVLIPYDDQIDEDMLVKQVKEKLKERDERYEGVITIDHLLV